MALSEAEFDRIEAYLDGKLSPDEHRQLEEELAQDGDLKQAVEEHRVIWEGLQVPVATAYFQDLHEQLDGLGLLFDDLWVEANSPDEHSTEHPTHHHSDHDEPEVIAVGDSKAADLDDASTTHIEVALHDEPETHVSLEHDERPDAWDSSVDVDPPHSHFDDSDSYA